MEEGRKEGRKEGIILARREDILENLSEIFTVTEEIKKIVNEMEDVDILKKWLRISIRVNSLEKFLMEIRNDVKE